MKKMARGNWQDGILNDLLRGREIENPIKNLAGKAGKYAGRYQNSFYSLLERIRENGYEIERKNGKRGGEWTATYRITNL